jgi:hypothetical protein
VSQQKVTALEIRLLREALDSDVKTGNIRLREGEYQYDLAKVIASFQLETHFPDVKDIIKRLYGEEKANDIMFVRKIQTILKKMEKSHIVTILQKKAPWELQKYALTSFRFQDVDKNIITLATNDELAQSQSLLQNIIEREGTSRASRIVFGAQVVASSSLVIATCGIAFWALLQPVVNAAVFVPAFLTASASSLVLGRVLSRR